MGTTTTPSGLLVGDCLERLTELDDNSIDAVVCDPPYELGFMGKKWDASGIAYRVDLWAEVLRVLKPGGHLLAFGGTRTSHRMVCAIEDAGFEVRDSIHWTYGSGFPKSPDVWTERIREVAGDGEAQQWDGWGTAMKPGHEPICVARTPLVGTVAANVLEWGTGAINIDGCRVGNNGGCVDAGATGGAPEAVSAYGDGLNGHVSAPVEGLGRWPSNVVFTHSWDCGDVCAPDCPVAELDRQSGTRTSGLMKAGTRTKGGQANAYGEFAPGEVPRDTYGDSGGASRFYPTFEWDPVADVVPFRYQAKPSRAERNAGCDGLPAGPRATLNDYAEPSEGRTAAKNGTDAQHGNRHPTVKPVALIRHLVRLVTPPGGVVLDPFLGSGTTAVAAILEGFDWVGCELTEDYVPIIEARVAWAEGEVRAGRQDTPRYKASKPEAPPGTPTLFDLIDA